MDKAKIVALIARVDAMSAQDREHLDDLCRALTKYREKTAAHRGYMVPGRSVALACVDLLDAWERAREYV